MPSEESTRTAEADVSDFREYVRQIIFRSLVLLTAAMLVAWPLDDAVGKGLALGGMLSILRFRTRANRLLRFDPARASRSAFLNALLMYAMTGAVLVFAAARNNFNLPAVVAGVFLTNLTVIAERLVPALRLDRDPISENP